MELWLDNNRNTSKTDYMHCFNAAEIEGHELYFFFIMSSKMKTKLFISENVVIAIRH